MNRFVKVGMDVVLYVIIFALLQFVVSYAGAAVSMLVSGPVSMDSYQSILKSMLENGKWIAIFAVLSNAITVLLFARMRWAEITNHYLKMKPWVVLIWVVLVALGSILPSEWLNELLGVTLSDERGKTLEALLKEPWGYAAIGLLAPLAEEVVFRGAVLALLLKTMGDERHWIAIAISAVLFAAAHFNMAQAPHAFLCGLLLGWMYYRTGSMIPGILFHWVNNTVAYVIINLLPWTEDGELINLFHGSQQRMMMGLVFSMMIMLPAIYQLHLRMSRKK